MRFPGVCLVALLSGCAPRGGSDEATPPGPVIESCHLVTDDVLWDSVAGSVTRQQLEGLPGEYRFAMEERRGPMAPLTIHGTLVLGEATKAAEDYLCQYSTEAFPCESGMSIPGAGTLVLDLKPLRFLSLPESHLDGTVTSHPIVISHRPKVDQTAWSIGAAGLDQGVYFDILEVDVNGFRGRWTDMGLVADPTPKGVFCSVRGPS